MLDRILESHQGIVKCKQRAREFLFWPGLSLQMEEVSKCSRMEPIPENQPRVPPDRSWSKMGSGLFEFNGVHHLLSVDDNSKWIEIAELDELTSSNVICHLKSQFARCSIPDELITDNGLGTKVQQSKISAGVKVFCTPLHVCSILRQIVKPREQCKPLRISSRKDKIPTRFY